MSAADDVRRSAKSWQRVTLWAWLAHLYTALGLVAAAGIAVFIVRGDVASFRWAFVLMLVATLIDATDGTLARLARVKDVLPEFDGRRLDDIIDFMTFTALPLLLVWRAEILPDQVAWCLLVPLVASAYGFCQSSAKTDDGYFFGFPSYWNIVAFFLYALQPPAWVSVAILVSLAVLTFVPTRYLYPSQAGRLNRLTGALGLVWFWLPLWVLFHLPNSNAAHANPLSPRTRWLAVMSLWYPVYYMLASWWTSFRRSRKA
jgi:phosphatidylcholine synthase